MLETGARDLGRRWDLQQIDLKFRQHNIFKVFGNVLIWTLSLI